MKKVVLISCTKEKRGYPCEAYKLYDESSLFKKSYAYAHMISSEVYIISAKYGLVPEYKMIAPYDETLNTKGVEERKEWGRRTAAQIKDRFDVENTEFVLLAGSRYCEPLIPYLKYFSMPLEGMPLGKRMQVLDEWIREKMLQPSSHEMQAHKDDGYGMNSLSYRVHKYFSSLPRFTYKDINDITYDNGICIFFEAGEKYCGMDRIVNIGTHSTDHRLKERIKDHYLREHKDGSIFRKNIGKALLNFYKSSYLEVWSYDTSNKQKTPQEILYRVDSRLQKCIEKQVSEHLINNITFVCVNVESKVDRIRLKEGIIACLNHDVEFAASEEWLGRYSPEYEITNSGMWLKQGLDGVDLTEEELQGIKEGKYSGKTEVSIQATIYHENTMQQEAKCAEGSYTSTQEILIFIQNKLRTLSYSGQKSLQLTSGSIAKEMNIKNRMPSVCSAMRKAMKDGDRIIYAPPKGNGTTLTIEYRL